MNTRNPILMACLLVWVLAAALPLGSCQEEKGIVFEDPGLLFKASLEKAAETGRPVMLDLYTDWCGWCKKLDNETYMDPAVAAFMNNFVNVKINAELGEGPSLVKRYKVRGYPFIVFVDSKGDEIDWIIGYLPADKFLKRVEVIHSGKDTFRDFKTRYTQDPADLDAAVGYAAKLKERGESAEAIAVYEAVLEAARPEKKPQAGDCLDALWQQALQERDFAAAAALIEELIADYPETSGIESAFLLLAQIYAKIDKDLDKAVALMQRGVERYTGTDNEDKFRYDLSGYLTEKGDYDAALAQLDRITSEENRDVVAGDKVGILVKKGATEEALAFCRQWLEKAGDDPVRINAVAWTCHENKILLEEALEWVRRVVVEIDKEQTTAYMDTYAWLLFDNGDPAKAAEWEEKALFAAETDKENETYAETLKKFREAVEKKDG